MTDLKLWNSEVHITKNHNCYDYAMDHLDPGQKRKSQPGMRAGMPNPGKDEFTCAAITKRLKADHPEHDMSFHAEMNSFTCPSGTKKSALFVDPLKDYHFYREEESFNNCKQKIWSHKPGEKMVQHYDGSWNFISDPSKADRHSNPFHYTHNCGFFCMPSLGNKTFSDMAYTPEK